MTGKDDPTLEETDACSEESQLVVENNHQEQEGFEVPDILYFLSQKSIAINLAALTIIWIAASSNFYTITFVAKYLPGDFNTNMVALFCADLPTSLVTWGLVSYLRPQTVIKVYSLLMLCGGLLLLYLVSDLNNLGAEFPSAVALTRVGTNGLF